MHDQFWKEGVSMRMTTAEMAKKYPKKWIGLSNVEFEEDGANIKTAEVTYTDKTASELAEMAMDGKDVRPYFTTPNEVFDMGGITW